MLLSDDATNRISKRKNTTYHTRLVSVKGVAVKDIIAQLLRKFASHLGMPTKRSASKLEIVQALLAFHDSPNSKFEDDGRKKSLVYCKQYLNVTFSDPIHPNLAMMG